jgi:predicted amidophosphoribosyltransferase
MGRTYPLRRRWFTTHFLQPVGNPKQPDKVVSVPLSLWNEYDDTFEHADASILDDLAQWIGLSAQEFTASFKLRTDCLQELAQDRSVDTYHMYDAIQALRQREQKHRP